jgi:monoamine oxidase
MRDSKYREKIAIIGAGIAGLSAAAALSKRGFEVVVLEARDRIGGRIWTDRSFGTPVDLGAASIELQQCNPLTPLARQWQVATRPIDYGRVAVYDCKRRRVENDVAEATSDRLERLVTKARRKAQRQASGGGLADQSSVETVLDAFGSKLDTERGRLERWALGVQACEYGAEFRDLSLAWFDDGFDEDWDDLLVVGGFDLIVDRLAEGLDIRLKREVTRIEYAGETPRVVCGESAFEADRVLVTLPLGVLKAGHVVFAPSLPESKLAALGRLAMGQVEKVVLQYTERFWPADVDFLGYASASPGEFPLFLSLFPATGHPVLVATTAGDHARSLASLDDEQVVARARRALEAMFGKTPPPSAVQITRWGGDRFSLGAYSYVPVGASGADYDELASPVGGRLFFAGESTYREHPATAHGAYLSGLREANRIAKCRDNVE